MNILLIEDDISKEQSIGTFLKEKFSQHLLHTSHSIMSGKVALLQVHCDCILLDMSLPLYDNDDVKHNLVEEHVFDPFGGMMILDEIDRLGNPCKVIILTAYDVLGENGNKKDLHTLTSELKMDFPEYVEDSVFYNISTNEWKEKLEILIERIEGSLHESVDS